MKLITAAQAAAAAVVATRLARGRQMRPPLRAGVPLPPGTTVSAVIPARDEAGADRPLRDRGPRRPGDQRGDRGGRRVHGRHRRGGRPGRGPGHPRPAPAARAGSASNGRCSRAWRWRRASTCSPWTPTRGPGPAWRRRWSRRPPEGLSTWSARAPGSSATARPNRACTRPCWPPWSTGSARSGRPASRARTAWSSTGSACWPAGPGWPRAGGFAPVRGHLTDDIALARDLARRGWRIGFLDGRDLLDVDMHASVAEVWREWGRSLPMTDVTSPAEPGRRPGGARAHHGAAAGPAGRRAADRAGPRPARACGCPCSARCAAATRRRARGCTSRRWPTWPRSSG